MNKMKTLFIALLCMGVGTLSAQTADSTQISPWTKEGFAGLKLTQVSLTNWLPEVITPLPLTCRALIRLIIRKENICGIIVLNWLMD